MRYFLVKKGLIRLRDRLRQNIRSTIEAVFFEELDGFLGRLRYSRDGGGVKGYRHGTRECQITGRFGTETISVPRARIEDADGKVSEWRSKAVPRYQRLTKAAEALITAVYLSGANTRRVKRAVFALFKGAMSKDVVSRAWRKVLLSIRNMGGESTAAWAVSSSMIWMRVVSGVLSSLSLMARPGWKLPW